MTVESDDLRPCPLCRGTDIANNRVAEATRLFDAPWSVWCTQCGKGWVVAGGEGLTVADVWNGRVTE